MFLLAVTVIIKIIRKMEKNIFCHFEVTDIFISEFSVAATWLCFWKIDVQSLF